MSNPVRATRTGFRLATLAATLVVALAGGIASASAQAAGGGNGGGNNGGGGGGNAGGTSSVLIYGQPGNCPPTVACGPRAERRPVYQYQTDGCDEYRIGSRLYRECRRGM